MADAYEQFFNPQPAGAPPADPYESLFHGPVVDQQEQDVIHRTNNPAVETPSSFGLADITSQLVGGLASGFAGPSEVAKGFASTAATLPRIPAGFLIQAGEQIPQTEGASMMDIAKMSLAKQALEYKAEQEKGGIAAWLDAVTPFKPFRMMANAEKDALLSLFSDTPAPKMLVNAGNAMLEQNKAAVHALGLNPEGGGNFGYDVGGALGQVGTMYLLKTPAAAQAYFGALVDSETYLEARDADLKAGKPPDPQKWARAAAENAYGQSLIFSLGASVLQKATAESSAMKRFLTKTVELAGIGAGTSAIDVGVKNAEGVRSDTLKEAATGIAYQTMIMMIAGAPVAAIHTKIESMGQNAGLPPEKTQALADQLINKKSEIVDQAVTLINKEASGVTNDAPARTETLKSVKKIFADQSAIEKAQADGKTEDPRIAAQLLLKKPQLSDEQRTAIATLLQGEFTMNDLHSIVRENKPPPKEPTTIEQDTAAIHPESTDARIMQGRIDKLDADIAAHDRHIDQLLATMDERDQQGKVNEGNQTKLDRLLQQREVMDTERAGLLTAERPLDVQKEALRAGEKKINVKGDVISGMAEKSAKDRARALNAGFRKGVALTKKNAKQAQTFVTDLINESGLSLQDKGKFLASIKNIQTPEHLAKNIQKIQSRVATLLDAAQRRELVDHIKDTVNKSKGSSVIAVDFAKQIEALANEIDMKNRQPATIQALQKTLDFMNANPDAAMPKDVLNKLEILNKKPLDQVSTQELQGIADAIDNLVTQGKAKLGLMDAQKERVKQQRIDELQKETVPLNSKETARAPIGERLAVMDRIKNRFTEMLNKANRVNIFKNPYDVFFDMLDGGKNYKGANYKIFKETVDKSYSKYLDLKDKTTAEVKALTDKLGLNAQNFEKIGAWAVLQQEGGKQKLLDSGVTQAEIDGLKLNPDEMKMYQLIRTKLDELLPALKEVMRTVYNKDVKSVKDYFPFMTDHEAMVGTEIIDQIGDNVPSIGKKKNVERGFTEERTLGKQKVRIDAMDVFMKHVDNAAYLIEMGRDIKALGDVAGSPEYGKAAGDIGQEGVVDWINLLARNGNVPGRVAVLDAIRRNIGFATLGFKLSSMLVQPTSLAHGAALVGGDYVSRGVMDVGTSPEWRKFLWDNMPEVRDRMGDDQAYLDMGGKGIVSHAREAGFWALKKLDGIAASAVAAGAYRKAVEEKGGKVDFSKPDPEAIAEAQRLMRRTQSSAFAKDAPALVTQGKLTGNVSLDKLILQFQSFMLNSWSLIEHDMYRLGIKKGDVKQSLNVATWIILATAAEVGIRRMSKDLIAAITGEDVKPWSDTIKSEAVSQALQTIPFVGQAVGALQYGSMPVPALNVLKQASDEIYLAGKSKDSTKRNKHLASAALFLGAAAAGIPGTVQAESLVKKSFK